MTDAPPSETSTWIDATDTVFIRFPKFTVFGFEGVLPTVTLTSSDDDGEIAESAGSVTLTADAERGGAHWRGERDALAGQRFGGR